MGVGVLKRGDDAAREMSIRFGGTAATIAALKAIPAAFRADGQVFFVGANRSMWMFVAAAAQTEDTAQELVVTPDAGNGRYIRADKAFVMKIPIAFGMADATVIETIPEGFSIRLAGMPFWEVAVSWTGGASSTIGISSSNLTGYTTKGDLLGGAAGDLAAALVAGTNAGTIGPKLDTLTEIQAFFLEEGNTLRYDEITSAFTAGSGFACFPVIIDSTAPATP